MTATQPTVFNVGQLHILEMLNRCNTEESLEALKKALFDFYSKEVSAEADRLWKSGVISDEKIEEWGKQMPFRQTNVAGASLSRHPRKVCNSRKICCLRQKNVEEQCDVTNNL